MNDLIDAVEQLRLLPDAYVDCGLRQERNVILHQLSEQSWQANNRLVDLCINDMKRTLANLIEFAKPFEIPKDYIFFLEEYGGLAIINDHYYFATLGIGPKVEINYSSVDSDEAFQETKQYGFLSIGTLKLNEGKYKRKGVEYFLDLAGIVQKDSIICIGPLKSDHFSVVKGLYSHSHACQKVADSFTNWLRLAAETEGSFGYI